MDAILPPPITVVAAGSTEVVTDSLGRSWDPLKHPRGRDGKFIRTWKHIKAFLTPDGTTAWGSGVVEAINPDGSINVRINHVVDPSYNNYLGHVTQLQPNTIESVNEKAVLPHVGGQIPSKAGTYDFNAPDFFSFAEKAGFSNEDADVSRNYIEQVRAGKDAPGDTRSRYLAALYAKHMSGDGKQHHDDEFASFLDDIGVDPSITDDTPDGMSGLKKLADDYNNDHHDSLYEDVPPLADSAIRVVRNKHTGEVTTHHEDGTVDGPQALPDQTQQATLPDQGGALFNVNGVTATADKAITDNEALNIEYYSGISHAPVNKALRAGDLSDPNVANVVHSLDGAIERSHATEDVKTYRGVSGYDMGIANFMKLVNGIEPGDVWSDHAFGSTTLDQHVAESEFAMTGAGNSAVFEITVPKGHHALYVAGWSKSPEEKELLLPRDTPIKITDKIPLDDNTWRFIGHVDPNFVPQDDHSDEVDLFGSSNIDTSDLHTLSSKVAASDSEFADEFGTAISAIADALDEEAIDPSEAHTQLVDIADELGSEDENNTKLVKLAHDVQDVADTLKVYIVPKKAYNGSDSQGGGNGGQQVHLDGPKPVQDLPSQKDGAGGGDAPGDGNGAVGGNPPDAPGSAGAGAAEGPKFEVLANPGKSGNGYVNNPGGQTLWGKYGAAGVMIRHVEDDGTERFLMVQRGKMLVGKNQGKWQLPGGALEELENDYQGSARELKEELSAPKEFLDKLVPVGEVNFKHPTGWHYNNIAADAPEKFEAKVDGTETGAAGWFTKEEIAKLSLHPALADKLDEIFAQFPEPDKKSHNAPNEPSVPNEPPPVAAALSDFHTTETLSSDEKAALSLYGVAIGYKLINPYLHHDKHVFDTSIMDYRPATQAESVKAEKAIKGLDSAFEKGDPLKKSVFVYRRSGEELFPHGDMTGKTFENLAYTSTATKLTSHGYGYETKPVQWDITLPVGTKALRGNSHENEVLLPRGGKFVVTGDTMVKGVRHLAVTYHPAGHEEHTTPPLPDFLKDPLESVDPNAKAYDNPPGYVDPAAAVVTTLAGEKDLTPAEQKAINAYVGGMDVIGGTSQPYEPINEALRAGKMPDDPQLVEVVKNLDSLLARSTTTKDLTLYRGSGWEAHQLDQYNAMISSLVPGAIIDDKAFVSTTKKEHIAKFFQTLGMTTSEAAQAKTIFYHIDVPEGSHAYDTDGGEGEVLFPRGSAFKVTSVGYDVPGHEIVHMQLVDNNEKKGYNGTDGHGQGQEGAGVPGSPGVDTGAGHGDATPGGAPGAGSPDDLSKSNFPDPTSKHVIDGFVDSVVVAADFGGTPYETALSDLSYYADDVNAGDHDWDPHEFDGLVQDLYKVLPEKHQAGLLQMQEKVHQLNNTPGPSANAPDAYKSGFPTPNSKDEFDNFMDQMFNQVQGVDQYHDLEKALDDLHAWSASVDDGKEHYDPKKFDGLVDEVIGQVPDAGYSSGDNLIHQIEGFQKQIHDLNDTKEPAFSSPDAPQHYPDTSTESAVNAMLDFFDDPDTQGVLHTVGAFKTIDEWEKLYEYLIDVENGAKTYNAEQMSAHLQAMKDSLPFLPGTADSMQLDALDQIENKIDSVATTIKHANNANTPATPQLTAHGLEPDATYHVTIDSHLLNKLDYGESLHQAADEFGAKVIEEDSDPGDADHPGYSFQVLEGTGSQLTELWDAVSTQQFPTDHQKIDDTPADAAAPGELWGPPVPDGWKGLDPNAPTVDYKGKTYKKGDNGWWFGEEPGDTISDIAVKGITESQAAKNSEPGPYSTDWQAMVDDKGAYRYGAGAKKIRIGDKVKSNNDGITGTIVSFEKNHKGVVVKSDIDGKKKARKNDTLVLQEAPAPAPVTHSDPANEPSPPEPSAPPEPDTSEVDSLTDEIVSVHGDEHEDYFGGALSDTLPHIHEKVMSHEMSPAAASDDLNGMADDFQQHGNESVANALHELADAYLALDSGGGPSKKTTPSPSANVPGDLNGHAGKLGDLSDSQWQSVYALDGDTPIPQDDSVGSSVWGGTIAEALDNIESAYSHGGLDINDVKESIKLLAFDIKDDNAKKNLYKLEKAIGDNAPGSYIKPDSLFAEHLELKGFSKDAFDALNGFTEDHGHMDMGDGSLTEEIAGLTEQLNTGQIDPNEFITSLKQVATMLKEPWNPKPADDLNKVIKKIEEDGLPDWEKELLGLSPTNADGLWAPEDHNIPGDAWSNDQLAKSVESLVHAVSSQNAHDGDGFTFKNGDYEVAYAENPDNGSAMISLFHKSDHHIPVESWLASDVANDPHGWAVEAATVVHDAEAAHQPIIDLGRGYAKLTPNLVPKLKHVDGTYYVEDTTTPHKRYYYYNNGKVQPAFDTPDEVGGYWSPVNNGTPEPASTPTDVHAATKAIRTEIPNTIGGLKTKFPNMPLAQMKQYRNAGYALDDAMQTEPGSDAWKSKIDKAVYNLEHAGPDAAPLLAKVKAHRDEVLSGGKSSFKTPDTSMLPDGYAKPPAGAVVIAHNTTNNNYLVKYADGTYHIYRTDGSSTAWLSGFGAEVENGAHADAGWVVTSLPSAHSSVLPDGYAPIPDGATPVGVHTNPANGSKTVAVKYADGTYHYHYADGDVIGIENHIGLKVENGTAHEWKTWADSDMSTNVPSPILPDGYAPLPTGATPLAVNKFSDVVLVKHADGTMHYYNQNGSTTQAWSDNVTVDPNSAGYWESNPGTWVPWAESDIGKESTALSQTVPSLPAGYAQLQPGDKIIAKYTGSTASGKPTYLIERDGKHIFYYGGGEVVESDHTVNWQSGGDWSPIHNNDVGGTPAAPIDLSVPPGSQFTAPSGHVWEKQSDGTWKNLTNGIEIGPTSSLYSNFDQNFKDQQSANTAVPDGSTLHYYGQVWTKHGDGSWTGGDAGAPAGSSMAKTLNDAWENKKANHPFGPSYADVPADATPMFRNKPNPDVYAVKNHDGSYAYYDADGTVKIVSAEDKNFVKSDNWELIGPDPHIPDEPTPEPVPIVKYGPNKNGWNGAPIYIGDKVQHDNGQVGVVHKLESGGQPGIGVTTPDGKKHIYHQNKLISLEPKTKTPGVQPVAEPPVPEKKNVPTPKKTPAPVHEPDPSSPWYGKAKPEAPAHPHYPDPPPAAMYVDDAWMQKADAFYQQRKIDTGKPVKPLADSYYYNRFVKVRDQGDLAEVDALLSKGLISQEMRDDAVAQINKSKPNVEAAKAEHLAKVAEIRDAYHQDMKSWRDDLKAWAKANGLPDVQLKGMTDDIKPWKKSEANAWMNNHGPYPGALNPGGKLTTAQSAAVGSQKSSNISGILRKHLKWDALGPNGVDLSSLDQYLKDNPNKTSSVTTIKNMQGAIEATPPLKEDILVLRTFDTQAFKDPDNPDVYLNAGADISNLVGTIHGDFGFSETTPGSIQGGETTSGLTMGNVTLELRVPAGFRGIWTKASGYHWSHAGEQGFILEGGIFYYIHSVEWNAKHQRWFVQAEVIPREYYDQFGNFKNQNPFFD